MNLEVTVMKTIESLMEKYETFADDSMPANLCLFLVEKLLDICNSASRDSIEEAIVTVNHIIELI